MSRLFDDASSEHLTRTDTCGISAYPFSFAYWARPDSLTDGAVMGFGDTSSDAYHWVGFRNPADTDIFLQAVNGGSVVNLSSGVTYSADTWYHVVAVFAGAQDHRLYVNGANKVTDVATSVAIGAIDNTTIGILLIFGSSFTPFSGNVADPALWDVALTDAEAASLGTAGYSPLLIRPQSLVAFWPLGGLYGVNSGNAADGDLDIVGGFDMDPQNTPSTGDHPSTIIYPSRRIQMVGGAAPPPAGIPILRRRRECA